VKFQKKKKTVALCDECMDFREREEEERSRNISKLQKDMKNDQTF
jgi:ribosomal protein L34E